jgi:hypothetical protein
MAEKYAEKYSEYKKNRIARAVNFSKLIISLHFRTARLTLEAVDSFVVMASCVSCYNLNLIGSHCLFGLQAQFTLSKYGLSLGHLDCDRVHVHEQVDATKVGLDRGQSLSEFLLHKHTQRPLWKMGVSGGQSFAVIRQPHSHVSGRSV